MEYVYYFANASLTLRVIEYLNSRPWLGINFITVIHDLDGWVVKIKFLGHLNSEEEGDFRAVLDEFGIPYQPEIQVKMAMWALEIGKSPLYVIANYQVAVVAHGSPNTAEIEEFCNQFIEDLGYSPQTLL